MIYTFISSGSNSKRGLYGYFANRLCNSIFFYLIFPEKTYYWELTCFLATTVKCDDKEQPLLDARVNTVFNTYCE